MQRSLTLCVTLIVGRSWSVSLLGAGEGPGSCPAAPFRGKKLNWPNGCPLTNPCCNEYGYCRPEAEWLAGQFRDCNGLSNGINLPDDVLKLEAFYAAIENGIVTDVDGLLPSLNSSSTEAATTTTTTEPTPTVVEVIVDENILNESDLREIGRAHV